jgi:adenosylhomocysteine nucleosidase
LEVIRVKRYGLIGVTIASLFIVAAVSLGFIFVSQVRADGKRPLGIISALSDELALIRDAMENEGKVRVVEEGQWAFHVGRLHGEKVVAFYCGMGKVNAAAGTQLLIQRFDVGGIVFSGVSGGVAKFTNIGDITISSEAAHHDYGTMIPIGGLPDVEYPETADLERGFVPAAVPIYKGGVMEHKAFFEAEPDFINLALKAGEELELEPVPGTNRLPVVRVGVIVTGDQFIASTRKGEWLDKVFGALATEMEGAAVAQVAYIHDIPWVIIRTNSDNADDAAGDITEDLFQYTAETSAKLVVKMVELLAEEKKVLLR